MAKALSYIIKETHRLQIGASRLTSSLVGTKQSRKTHLRFTSYAANPCLFGSLVAGASLMTAGCSAPKDESATPPNVIIILADDLGYGDISGYGATAIQTPNIDRLIQNGLRFTRGYSTSATSTPSRFAIMTGMYPWRNKDAQILPGDAPLIIQPDVETLPDMFRKAGYSTGVVGKWHLGLGNGRINWNGNITPSPNDRGFDYSFIMAATNDRVPCVYVEDGRVVNLDPNDPIEVSYHRNFDGEPTGKNNPELLKVFASDEHHKMSIVNGISRIGFMRGGKSALWVDETMAEVFLNQAIGFIDKQIGASDKQTIASDKQTIASGKQTIASGKQTIASGKQKPFFLYYALHEPHAPRVSNEKFAGQSELGVRGDVILEADWCIGQLLDYLDKKGNLENTVIILSSDNGPVATEGYIDDGLEKLADHTPAGPFRGGKYSLFEGGTRVPFIVQWLGVVKPGISDAMVCHLDFYNSFASLIGQPVNPQKDSQNLMDALLGKSTKGRDNLVQEAMGKLAYRQGDWAYIPSYQGVDRIANNDTGNSTVEQLYQLSRDTGELENLASKEPAKLEEMRKSFLQLDTYFPAGNIHVMNIKDDTVYLRQDLRDTEGQWFYWSFRVKGAAGRTLHFKFTNGSVISSRGPAVSLDGGISWRWLGNPGSSDTKFHYSFGPKDNEVYFSMGMNYTEKDLDRFLSNYKKHPDLNIETLCTSKKGRKVELLRIFNRKSTHDYKILLTSRHHCGEMMANRALEGIIETVLSDTEDGRWFRNHCDFFIVPFVDKDGVEDGDQGKNRRPHDHNRDYQLQVYPEIRAIIEQVPNWLDGKPLFFLDLHCPWLRGGADGNTPEQGTNEFLYFVGLNPEKHKNQFDQIHKFGSILEKVKKGAIPYQSSFNLPYGISWNTSSNVKSSDLINSSEWAETLPNTIFSSIVEIPFANASGVVVDMNSARELGYDLAKAIRIFCENSN